jgi:serine protease AprX
MRTRTNKTKTTNAAASLLLVLALCLGILPGAGLNAVQAQQANSSGNPKMSADLNQLFNQNPSSNEMAQIIVETPSTPTKSLLTELSSSGGLAPVKYTHMTMVYGSTQVQKLDELAARSDVRYISLNRQAKRTGHISLTSGADAARALGGSTPYQGNGIGIAVMDSGIMTNHLSFQDPGNATTRIKASVDFTGQNRVDDPYGHGTHVAGMAAGNEMVSGGAYRGIAARADIINLRVLNSQGTGSLSGILSAIDWIITNRTTHNIVWST